MTEKKIEDVFSTSLADMSTHFKWNFPLGAFFSPMFTHPTADYSYQFNKNKKLKYLNNSVEL